MDQQITFPVAASPTVIIHFDTVQTQNIKDRA